MDRTRSFAAPLLALMLLGYAPALLAAPPPPPDGCLSDEDCDDGDLCNGVERCVKPEDRPGRCRPGVGRVCQDLDPCTSDACVANECIHEPIPDCPAATTTSTSTTSTSTVTTTTRPSPPSSLPTPTTSTTGPPSTTTTSTTLPPRACVFPDPAACNDGDACTTDVCTEIGVCVQLPLTGAASVACICDRALPAACQQPLPRRIGRLITRGCRQARRALGLSVSGQRSPLRVADRAFANAAARAVGSGRNGTLDSACADALATLLRDARTRARAARGIR